MNASEWMVVRLRLPAAHFTSRIFVYSSAMPVSLLLICPLKESHIQCACLLVLEHCAADQIFLIPLRGVHRMTEQ